MDEKELKELLKTNKLGKVIAQYNKFYNPFSPEPREIFVCEYAKYCQKENCYEGTNHQHYVPQNGCLIIPDKHGCPAEFFEDSRQKPIYPCLKKTVIPMREGDKVIFIHNPDGYSLQASNPLVCTKHFTVGKILSAEKHSTNVSWENGTSNCYGTYRHLEYWQVFKRTLLNMSEINLLYSISISS